MFFEAGLFYLWHLLGTLLVIVPLFIWLSIKYKTASLSDKLKPIRIISLCLIGFEIIKIFLLISYDGYLAPLRYPIVFCSIILYSYVLFAFKENKLSEGARAISIIPAILAGLAFLIMPGNITPEQTQINNWTLSHLMPIHSFVFHIIMIAVAVYMLVTKIYVFRKDNYYQAFLSIVVYIGLATIISIGIGADISIFGPNSGQLSILYNNFGYIGGQLILLLVSFGLFYGVHQLFGKKIKKEVVNADIIPQSTQ